jgi:hypothetical protein
MLFMSMSWYDVTKLRTVTAILFYILEVLASNLGQETGYPDRGLSWFSYVPGECRKSILKLGRDCFF